MRMEQDHSARPVPPSASIGGRPLRILLIEDSRPDAELVAARLEEDGIQAELQRVDTAAGFDAAFEGAPFDAILSDFHVPGFGGLEALERARARVPNVPFLVVSGALGEERAIEVLKRGAVDYVLKDRLDRLSSSLRRALRERQEHEERRQAEEALTFLERASPSSLRRSISPPPRGR